MSITIDDAQVMAELGAIHDRLNNPAPLFEAVGQWQEQQIEQRIESGKTTPDGMPWEAWRLPTLRHRTRKGNAYQGLLWDEGDLLRSFGFDVAEDSVEIGTHLDIAEWLQDGTSNMAARQFVGWSTEDMEELEAMALAFMEKGELQ